MIKYSLKNLLVVGGLLLAASFISCGGDVSDKAENTTQGKIIVNTDTNLNGLTGVIEASPPVMNGDHVVKYPNGIVKMKGFYINGKREGQWISFFPNGVKQSEGFFKAGLRDGKAQVYFEGGQLYYEGYYKEGREVGKWVFFDQQGKKINEKDFGSQ